MKLKGKVSTISKSLEDKPLITFEIDGDMPNLTDDIYEIALTKHRQKRSLDANAYCWVLIGKMAEKLGKPKSEIYREYIKEIGAFETVCAKEAAVERLCAVWSAKGLGWVYDIVPSKIDGCKVILLYYGSSTYNSQEMSKLIDLIVQDCKQLGIETATPQELALVKDEWR